MTSPGRWLVGALTIAAWCAPSLMAQAGKKQNPAAAAPKPAKNSFQTQGTSSVSYKVTDDEEIAEIHNVAYEITSEGVPGRPLSERLLLRKTTTSKQMIGDIGQKASTTLEAWPLGTDPRQKPIYTITSPGRDGQTLESSLFLVNRGVEDVDWWSIYRLGTGQHLFDTYIPLVQFSLSREIQELRYLGLEVPPDDASDARLKEPHIVGVLTYASNEKVIREVMITSDNPTQAQMLREYEEVTRTVSVVETPAPAVAGKRPPEPLRSIRISIRENYPSPPDTVTIVIPVVGGDLDLAHAQVPTRIHIAAWRR